ncbi:MULTISPECIES: SRPBCC family protein [Streptomyces]|uniref:SRPBCC family protein n=1 Tax=Streptomyces TaxID=1883 RepID=UPI001E614149|nr:MULTISPECIES: SRPBCC family protein [Streptomyces]UFQ14117.1 SRPBCC family protein [Streptomyces huasconensis]WCL83716.1 SRPBCC family protein [Streptomyces sp. JCM 35825]
METMTVERVIDAPIDDVFAWLTTTTNYTRSPLVVRCRLTRRGKGAPYGVGAVRGHLWLIGWFEERITAYDPPYATEYVVDRSLPPSRHELGRMTFAEVDGGTRVRWTTRAEVRVPLLGALLTRRVARPVITRTFGTILEAADTALTGASAGRGRSRAPRAHTGGCRAPSG